MATKTKVKKKTVKKVTTRKKKVVAVVQEPATQAPPITPQVNEATKQFIAENLGKISLKEIADACGLRVEQVEAVATSTDLDPKVGDGTEGVSFIRRFIKKGNSIQMTQQQSMMDDMNQSKNYPTKDEINKQFGKDFEIIKKNQPTQ